MNFSQCGRFTPRKKAIKPQVEFLAFLGTTTGKIEQSVRRQFVPQTFDPGELSAL